VGKCLPFLKSPILYIHGRRPGLDTPVQAHDAGVRQAVYKMKEGRIVMRRIATCLFILFSVSATTIPVNGAEDRITVVVDENYPPYMFGTPDQARGLYPRLMAEIFARDGMEVSIRALPWKSALQAGEEGRAGVGGIYKTRARMEVYDYSEPFFEEHLVVYVRKGEAFPFSQLANLQGRAIGLNRAWSYGDAFDAARKNYGFTVEESDSNLENFKKLVAGRIDCLVADQVAASRIIQQKGWEDRVERLEQPAAVNPAHLAFSKRLEKGQVLEQFDRSLAEMRKDGSYERLVQDFAADGKE
jgi:polar amino acid transport system substrate-binding protein